MRRRALVALLGPNRTLLQLFGKQPKLSPPCVFKPTFSGLGKHSPHVRAGDVALSQPFRICKAECGQTDISVYLNLCVPQPTNHNQAAKTIPRLPFLQWFGKAFQTLGFQDIPKMPLCEAYRVCVAECVQKNSISVHLNLCAPHPAKQIKVSNTNTKPSVFASVLEGIHTFWISNILVRLAGWSPSMPLSQPFRVCPGALAV